MGCSLPGSFVHGILQARTLQWVAISFSNAWKWKVKVKSLSLWDEYNWAVVWALFGIAFLWDWSENWPFPVLWPLQRKLHWTLVMSCACVLSCVLFFVTLWTVAHQATLSMGFSRQECWSGLPFPSPGDLSRPGVEVGPPTLQADSLPSEPLGVVQRPVES